MFRILTKTFIDSMQKVQPLHQVQPSRKLKKRVSFQMQEDQHTEQVTDDNLQRKPFPKVERTQKIPLSPHPSAAVKFGSKDINDTVHEVNGMKNEALLEEIQIQLNHILERMGSLTESMSRLEKRTTDNENALRRVVETLSQTDTSRPRTPTNQLSKSNTPPPYALTPNHSMPINVDKHKRQSINNHMDGKEEDDEVVLQDMYSILFDHKI